MKTTTIDSSKIRVGILFGGKSAEHEVSVQSAKNVVAALDTDKFEPILIGIDTQGGWQQLSGVEEIKHIETLGSYPRHISSTQALATIETSTQKLDAIFPILHGPLGEDGTVQGLLELADIPYVGCGVLSSAIGMDKDVMKRLLREAGVPTTDFVTITLAEREQVNMKKIINQLGLPLFVKPANMGSSVGVGKISSEAEFLQAIEVAFRYDTKILIEKAVLGDEVECAILGNEQPEASVLGRVIPKASFYTYEAKYSAGDGTVLEIPAKLPEEITKKAQAIALKTFKTLGCAGMARVDMFVTKDGAVLVNEINTIPGFTKLSMYPQLWEASGVPYSELITRLVELAMERFDRKQHLQTFYSTSALAE